MKTVNIIIASILILTSITYGTELALELTGIVVSHNPSIKTAYKSGCILNNRIFFEGDVVELEDNSLGAVVDKPKAHYPYLVIKTIKIGKVTVVKYMDDKDLDGSIVEILMKKRTYYGLLKE
jgi:hypothetical protein